MVGKQKYPESDGGTLAYDSKRDVLWMASFAELTVKRLRRGIEAAGEMIT